MAPVFAGGIVAIGGSWGDCELELPLEALDEIVVDDAAWVEADVEVLAEDG